MSELVADIRSGGADGVQPLGGRGLLLRRGGRGGEGGLASPLAGGRVDEHCSVSTLLLDSEHSFLTLSSGWGRGLADALYGGGGVTAAWGRCASAQTRSSRLADGERTTSG